MVFYMIYFKAQQRKEVLDGVPKKIEAMTTPVVKEEEGGEVAKDRGGTNLKLLITRHF